MAADVSVEEGCDGVFVQEEHGERQDDGDAPSV